MGRDRGPQAPDLFPTGSSRETFSPATKPVTSAPERRHVLPKDLPNAVKHLHDRELDLLIAVALEDAKRRGRAPPSHQIITPDASVPKRSSRTHKTSHPRQVRAATLSLTSGQINAVRAAFNPILYLVFMSDLRAVRVELSKKLGLTQKYAGRTALSLPVHPAKNSAPPASRQLAAKPSPISG
jgi:hypothetical protein